MKYMKRIGRMTSLLLALLLCLGGAALAETESLRVEEFRYVPRADGTGLLHLVISKTGLAVTLDGVDADFYDADGAKVEGVSVTLFGAAMLTLPEGEASMPITLLVQPPEGAEIARCIVNGAYGSAAEEGEIPAFIEDADGVFFLRGSAGLVLFAFHMAVEDIDPMYYTGYAILYDQDDEYLGNVFLPLGSGVYVAENDMLNALSRYIARDALLNMGIRESNTPASVLFMGIPMSGLPEGALPAVGKVVVCALPPQEDKALTIVAFEFEAADGQFVIRASAQNTSGAAVLLETVPYVVLQDVSGNVRIVEEVTLTGPGKAFAPGETLEFVLSGLLEDGFDPVGCAFSTRCTLAE